MTVKTALLLVGGLTLVTGLVVAIILVGQRQLLDKQAAVPSGSATFSLSPATSEVGVNETIAITGVLNTGSTNTSGYTIKGDITFSGSAPVDIVNSDGTPATTITNLLTSDLTFCAENSITRSSGQISFIISCLTPPSNTVGYSTNGQSVNALSFLLKGIVEGQTATITLDNDISRVDDKSTNTDTLTFPTGGTYTVQAAQVATPTPTVAPAATVTPTPDPTIPTATPVPGATATPTPTTVPAATVTPTPSSQSAASPNSCNGTCGSNANCSGELFCDTVTGRCRNPQCPTSDTCGCQQATGTGGGTTSTSTTTTTTTSSLPQSGNTQGTLILGGLGILIIIASLAFLL